MEADTNVYSDKNLVRRPNESSNGAMSDKARRGGPSSRGTRGGKRGGAEGGGRSRRGRGRRGGGGKSSESTRGSISNTSSIPNPNTSKPLIKPKTEPRDPPLLEVGHKVVIRHLPPTLPKEILLEAAGSIVSIEQTEWNTFIPGKVSENPSKPRIFSRAYFRFTDSALALKFIDGFNGHVFVDSKGVQDRAIVEYAPYRKTPKQARADPKQNTIEEDVEYQEFLASLNSDAAPEPPTPTPQPVALSAEKQKITPLIEFLRAKKAAQVESRSFRPAKSSVTLLSRNDKGKNSDSSGKQASTFQENGSKNKEDKRSKKSKSSKNQPKEPKQQPEFKPNGEDGASRRSRRRVRKKGPFKEESSAPNTPIQILKHPPKEPESDWPQPGNSSQSANQSKELNGKSDTSLTTSEAKSTPVRHVFTLTNGCLTQSTKSSSEPLDNITPKGSRNNRRRRPPPSKPQAAS